MSEDPHHNGHAVTQRPWSRLMAVLRLERRDVATILIFAVGVGLLSIVTPAAIEALVNTVAFGILLWPVVVLALVMFAFLAFAATLRSMQLFVAECLQRRVFVRTAHDFAIRFATAKIETFDGRNPTDSVNRFLEVATAQKALATLLVDGIAIVMITIVGLTVLAFYHPYLLTFALVMVALVTFLLTALGIGGVRTSIGESSAKYDTVAWLEEIAKCPHSFRFGRGADLAIDRTDQLADSYIGRRRDHFRVVWRQTVFALLLEAIASTVLLGLGGWLVINRQLNLGQLVAGELIVTLVLSALSKIGKYLEIFYDLQASLMKLAVIDGFELEPVGGEQLPESSQPMSVTAEMRCHRGPTTEDAGPPLLRLEALPGERVAVTGPPGSGKTFLLETLGLLRLPPEGLLELDSIDARSLDRPHTRLQIGFVGRPEIFVGTVAENIRVGRDELTAADIRRALELVGLADRIARLPQGVATPLAADGLPLSTNELARLALARSIAGRPRLLLIDGMLDGLDTGACPELVDSLFDRAAPWTLVIVTARGDVRQRCDKTVEWS